MHTELFSVQVLCVQEVKLCFVGWLPNFQMVKLNCACSETPFRWELGSLWPGFPLLSRLENSEFLFYCLPLLIFAQKHLFKAHCLK